MEGHPAKKSILPSRKFHLQMCAGRAGHVWISEVDEVEGIIVVLQNIN